MLKGYILYSRGEKRTRGKEEADKKTINEVSGMVIAGMSCNPTALVDGCTLVSSIQKETTAW